MATWLFNGVSTLSTSQWENDSRVSASHIRSVSCVKAFNPQFQGAVDVQDVMPCAVTTSQAHHIFITWWRCLKTESLGNLSPSRLHVAKSSRSCTPTTSRTCLRRLKADQRKKVFWCFLYGSVLTVMATRSKMFHWFASQVWKVQIGLYNWTTLNDDTTTLSQVFS